MNSFADRLWLAWRVLRGRAVNFRADAESTRVVFEFTSKERANVAKRVNRPSKGL